MRKLALALVLLALGGCGGGEKPTVSVATVDLPTASTAEVPGTPQSAEQVNVAIAYSNGKLDGGIKTVKVPKGTHVVIDVTSDVDDEVHVHGPDVMQNVGPSAPAHLEFDAADPGRYEVELEQRGVQIADVQVQP